MDATVNDDTKPGQRHMLRAARIVNLVLLILYPASWFAPLATAGVLPFFSGSEITILRGVIDLWEADPALSLLVAVLAVLIPYTKTLCLSGIHFGYLGPQRLPLLEAIGRLSMADVFLIALYIVVVKGVGIGEVDTAWGLWLFTICVLASMAVAWATRRALTLSPPADPR